MLHPNLQRYKQALLCLELMVTDTSIPWQKGHTPQSQTHKREKWRWKAFTLPSECLAAELLGISPELSVCSQAWDGELRFAWAAISQFTIAQSATSQSLQGSPWIQQNRVLITKNVTFMLKQSRVFSGCGSAGSSEDEVCPWYYHCFILNEERN